MLEAMRSKKDGLWRLRYRHITNRQAFLKDDTGYVLTFATKKAAEQFRRVYERDNTSGWASNDKDHFATRGNRHATR